MAETGDDSHPQKGKSMEFLISARVKDVTTKYQKCDEG